MVDIHCHILPEVDDGAADWETAVAMCRMAQQDGIEHIVASPHANDEYRYDRAEHEERLEQLRQRSGGELQFSLGCDFHLSYENIQDSIANPSKYCIGGTRYLLVEFSDYALPPNADELLSGFLGHGITPIITHPERNPILQRRPKIVVDWAREGMVVQVTANSLSGRWGSTARKVIEFLLQNDAVHVVATDAHDLKSRPPILSEARQVLTKLVSREFAELVVDHNPRAIVSGKRVLNG